MSDLENKDEILEEIIDKAGKDSEEKAETKTEQPETEVVSPEDKSPVEPVDSRKSSWLTERNIFAFLAGLAIVILIISICYACNAGKGHEAKKETTATHETSSKTSQGAAENTEGETVVLPGDESFSETKEDESEAPEASETEKSDETAEDKPTKKDPSATQKDDETKKETTSKKDNVDNKESHNAGDKESASQKPTKDTTAESSSGKDPVKPSQTTAAPTVATPVAPTSPNPPAESGTPFANHGKLSVSGTNILDKNGNIYQLKGVSTHGIAWFPAYVNKEAFRTMRDEWGVNVVRLAMYTGENMGYCAGGNQANLKALIDKGVQAATELGMYVIIDWHVLNDPKSPVQEGFFHVSESKKFFQEMSTKYASYGNVIYELCNEPNGGVGWNDIKTYAETMIPIIRKNCDNIIIVGTPTWSQDVDQAAANPIKGQVNVMYALHFYAATHKDYLWNRMAAAIQAGLPIFVSEYGICDASGNGSYDIASANTWMAMMDQYHVSSCIWNLSNKAESSSLIQNAYSKTSGWTYNELSGEGQWFVNMLKGGNTGTTPGKPQPTQPQPTQPQPTQPQPTQPTAVQANGKNCSLSATAGNSWEGEGQKKFAQINVVMKNTSTAPVTGWKVVLTFSANVELDQNWNAKATVSGKTVTLTASETWNQTLAAGQQFDLGLIVKSSSAVQLVKAEIK